MIDLGLSKLAIIGVVALVVIGPERLPKVARMVGSLYGRAQRYISQVKSEVSNELELEEMRRMQKEMQQAAQDFQSSVTEQVNEQVGELETELNRDLPKFWSGDEEQYQQIHSIPDPARLAYKAKEFRRKKLNRISSVPMWYKNRNGARARVLSGAARVAKYRGKKTSSSFY